MIAIPLHTRRVQRGQFAQKLQHAIPSVVVLGDGISHLQHDPHGIDLALGVAEIGVSVLVIGSVIRGFRQLRAHRAAALHAPHSTHGIDWIDVSLGAMLSVEVYAKYYANGHIARPTILLAVTMFVVGFNHGRLAAWGSRKRELRITNDGISVPGRFFTRLTLPWAELAEITIGPDKARVIATDGRDKQIELADAFGADAIRAALLEAQARHGAYRATLMY